MIRLGTWPGYARGAVSDAAKQGNYAYVAASYGGLLILDISTPTNPVVVGNYDSDGYAEAVTIAGDYAWLSDDSGGLKIIDVRNPSRPQLVRRLPLPDNVNRVAVAEKRAFATIGSQRVEVIDISDLAAARSIGRFRVSSRGNAKDVSVLGQYVFVAAGDDGLLFYHTSTPPGSQPVSSFHGYGISIVHARGNYAYAVSNATLVILNITDPTNMTAVSQLQVNTGAWDLFVAEPYAYIATGGDGVLVVDISNPAAPRPAGRIILPETPTHLFVDDHLLLASGNYAGMQIFDVSSPGTEGGVSRLAKYLPGSSGPLDVEGNRAYLFEWQGGLRILDVRDPQAIVLLGQYALECEPAAIDVHGDYAFLADYTNGVHIVDISNPTLPRLAGRFTFPRGLYATTVYDIAVQGPFAYVASTEGFTVLSITNPAVPAVVQTLSIPCQAIRLRGTNGYLAAGRNGLVILDLSVPAQVTQLGALEMFDDPPVKLDIADNYAYVLRQKGGLLKIDISDPTRPVPGRFLDTGDFPRAVKVAGRYAYVADLYRLYVMDTSTLFPTVIRPQFSPEVCNGFCSVGPYLFLTSGMTGLHVYTRPEYATLAARQSVNGLDVWWSPSIPNQVLEMAELPALTWTTAPSGGTNPVTLPPAGPGTLFRVNSR